MSAVNAGALAVVAAVVLALEHREQRRRRRPGAGPWWPWLIAVIARQRDRDGADLPTATVRACLGGPPELRSVTEQVVATGGGADALQLLSALRDRIGSAAGDRVFGTIAALHIRGAPASSALAWLRADASAVAAHEQACAAITGGGNIARWLLLAPVVPWVTGYLHGVPGLSVAITAVGLWWGAGRWLRDRPDTRVLVTEPAGATR